MKKIVLLAGLLFLFTACGKNLGEQGFDKYQQGDYKGAIELFTQYIADHPQDADAFYNRGRAYEESGELDKAIEDFNTATTISPDEHSFWMSLGICNFKLKRYANTVSNMDALLQKNANDAQAYVLQGRAYSHLKEVKKAIDAFDAALRADERSGEAYLHRGILKSAAGAVSGGCSDLKKAESLGVKEAPSFYKKWCR